MKRTNGVGEIENVLSGGPPTFLVFDADKWVKPLAVRIYLYLTEFRILGPARR